MPSYRVFLVFNATTINIVRNQERYSVALAKGNINTQRFRSVYLGKHIVKIYKFLRTIKAH
jgi:hypothetical protein